MKRRTLFGAGLALAGCHGIALAQPALRKPRIGWLSGSTPDPLTLRSQVEPLRRGLRELGWVEGQNLATIEFRWAEGKLDRLPALLDELLRLDLDVLVTTSPRPALLPKDKAPKTLPIVAIGIDDPVQAGLAASIARPGANITGISAAFTGVLDRRLQLMKDIVPGARRFGIVYNLVSAPDLADALPALAAELAALRPDVIYTLNSAGAEAAARATSTTPIVVGMAAETTLVGLAGNLARPVGNLTGYALNLSEQGTVEKCLELLAQLAPRTPRVAIVLDPDSLALRVDAGRLQRALHELVMYAPREHAHRVCAPFGGSATASQP